MSAASAVFLWPLSLGDLLRKAAGVPEKAEPIVILPGQGYLSPHIVEGADQLHSRKFVLQSLGSMVLNCPP